MATLEEMIMQDAPASVQTTYTIAVGDGFGGLLDGVTDQDWVRVELDAGRRYDIRLTGVGPDADTDTVLRLYDAGGEQVAFNDDVEYAAGKVNSLVMFTPAVTGAYYIGAGAYRGNPSRDNSGRYQVTVYDADAAAGFTLAGTGEDDRRHNELVGGPGDDVLDGGAGNDWLEGGAGADVLRGGAGDDTARYRYSDAGVVVRLHDGTARGGDAEGDTFGGTVRVERTGAGAIAQRVALPDIENLTGSDYADILAGDLRDNRLLGGDGNDVLYGGPGGGDDVLMGEAGHDTVYGGKGDDTLEGGPGNDRLLGGPDNDSVTGGAGDDTFVFGPGGGNDTVPDFGNGEDKIDLTAFADIRSTEDLIMEQQGNHLVVDFSGHGGGTVILRDFNVADVMETQFVFVADESVMMA